MHLVWCSVQWTRGAIRYYELMLICHKSSMEPSLNCDSSQTGFPQKLLEIDVSIRLKNYHHQFKRNQGSWSERETFQTCDDHTNDFTWMKFWWAGWPTLQCITIGGHTKIHCYIVTLVDTHCTLLHWRTHQNTFSGSAIKSSSSTTSSWTPTSSFRALDA